MSTVVHSQAELEPFWASFEPSLTSTASSKGTLLSLKPGVSTTVEKEAVEETEVEQAALSGKHTRRTNVRVMGLEWAV